MIFSSPYANRNKDSTRDILNHFDAELYYNRSIQEIPRLLYIDLCNIKDSRSTGWIREWSSTEIQL